MMAADAEVSDWHEWHFYREQLARKYLNILELGLTPSIVIYAPREKGKTQFLHDDLLPIAGAEGYRAVYCSVCNGHSNPFSAIISALIEAAKPRNLKERIVRACEGDSSGTLEVSLEKFGNVMKSDPAVEARDRETLLSSLPSLLNEVSRISGGKVLLALDDVDHLASPRFDDLVAALRTGLDLRKSTVKSVFTGSSKTNLASIFSHPDAPFFQFSYRVELPELDIEFVDFMLAEFQNATGREILPQSS